MKTQNYLIRSALFLFAISISLTAFSRKVVCVDDKGNGSTDGYLSRHEGWERQTAKPGDVITVGGSLADCIAQLQNGDTLVIIAHGAPGAFGWGGQTYEGFGNGDNEIQLPPGFNKTNIHVKFCSCNSAADPDPEDDAVDPLTDDIEDAMGGGATAEGFEDYAGIKDCVKWNGGTAAKCKAAYDALIADPSWQKNPPHNRVPAPATSDQSAAQAIATAIDPAVTITIVYKPPYNTPNADGTPGSLIGPVNGLITGCGCYDSEDGCGFAFSEFADVPYTPELALTNNNMMPNGVYTSSLATVLFPSPGSTHTPVKIENLRIYGLMNSNSIPPPGGFGTINTPLQAVAIVTDPVTGISFEQTFFGFFNAMATTLPYLAADGTIYVDVIPQAVSLNGLPPGEPVLTSINTLNLFTDLPSSGALSYRPMAGGLWAVDSFFDITYIAIMNDGSSAAACQATSMVLTCGTPTSGCTNTSAENFDPCAVADNGNCIMPHSGCTYPAASNYDPTAANDDGSCLLGSSCPTDLTGDGATNTSDLLIFLAAFGGVCP